jgi:hypothetical protein
MKFATFVVLILMFSTLCIVCPKDGHSQGRSFYLSNPAQLHQHLSTVPQLAQADASKKVDQSTQNKNKIERIELQLQFMEKYDSRLISTVYWSLGTVVTIAILLVGFGWFANFRIHERDKSAMMQEINGQFATEKSDLEEYIRNEIEKTNKEIKDVINISVEIKREFKNEMLTQKITLEKMESEQWEEKGVLANSLDCELRILNIVVGMDWSWRISNTVDRIEKLIASGAEIDADLTHSIDTILQKMPKKYDLLKGRLKAVIAPAR